MAARIMSGRQVTGHFGPVSVPPAFASRYLTLVSSCGSMGVTSRKDTKPFVWRGATSAGYQAVTSPPRKPRNAPTSISRRSWRLIYRCDQKASRAFENSAQHALCNSFMKKKSNQHSKPRKRTAMNSFIQPNMLRSRSTDLCPKCVKSVNAFRERD